MAGASFSASIAGRPECGLTIRSTGPIAAGRHLGYKSLAQMPARRNGPVSSNVRAHNFTPAHFIENNTYKEVHGQS